jgi:hypothetical protein
MRTNNFEKDLKILIIRENGNIDAIFGADDESCKNLIQIKNEDNNDVSEQLLFFYENSIDKTSNNDSCMDKHLFYLKDFLKTNFIQEFKNININPQNINDDIWLYFFLSQMNNIVIINSDEHINLLITPINGISKEQSDKLNSISDLFSPSTLWDLAYEMHTEIDEFNGQKFLTLNEGDSITGNFETVISKCKVLDSKGKIHK